MNVQPSKHLIFVNGYTHQGQWYEGDSRLSFRDPYALAKCWGNYFNNQILEVIQNLWKDYHFIGNTDRISVFGIRPYGTAIRHLSMAKYVNPKGFIELEKNPVYEPLLYCGFCNQLLHYLPLVKAPTIALPVPHGNLLSALLTTFGTRRQNVISRLLIKPLLSLTVPEKNVISSNISIVVFLPNIIKALTLNVLTSGYDMDEGSKPFALIYRIYCRLVGSQLNPRAAHIKDPARKTLLIQCSTPDAKIQVPKMIQWEDVNLPKEWLLERESPPTKPIYHETDLAHIQQYLDGFHDDKPLKINEGRHSFAGFESASKRDLDLTDYLQKNSVVKPDLKLKGVSSNNSQVSTAFYSTKAKTSSPYEKSANEEEETKSVSPSNSDFQTVEPPIFQSQLRVLTSLNKSFEIDMVSLINKFISAKNRDKRKYYQSTFAQSEKDRVKRKWKEKMNALKKHILFF
ncbi:hypothetical protein SO802_009766 [Lithocarpus litseifolius]|uniref:DUF7588 domain-containing protein n=1 Tax=Lithocarpus litseifolius TaxID=425828 RepID=A0AAW2DDE5_9ROSI